MVFWGVITAMSALAALAVLWPLLRRSGVESVGASDQAHEIAVYKDQLTEIGRDKARGQIGSAEAEAARVEIARRLLKAAESEPRAAKPRRSLNARRTAAVLALAIPLLSLVLYIRYGAPDLPDQAITARLANAEANNDLPAMMRKVELALDKNPEDARGWTVLAPLYLRTHQPEKAVRAITNIMRLTGETADLNVELGNALIEASPQESIDPRAMTAINAALKLDSGHPKAHFIHAYLLSTSGNSSGAKAELLALKASAPANAPWISNVDAALAALKTQESAQQAAAPGPTASDVQGAAQMSAEERSAMISTMVQRLADKLHANPKDIEGWLRLIRAYIVLKKPDAVQAAATEAKAAFAGDAAALAQINQAEKGGE